MTKLEAICARLYNISSEHEDMFDVIGRFVAKAPDDIKLLLLVIEEIQTAFNVDNRIEWYEPEKVKSALKRLEEED